MAFIPQHVLMFWQFRGYFLPTHYSMSGCRTPCGVINWTGDVMNNQEGFYFQSGWFLSYALIGNCCGTSTEMGRILVASEDANWWMLVLWNPSTSLFSPISGVELIALFCQCLSLYFRCHFQTINTAQFQMVVLVKNAWDGTQPFGTDLLKSLKQARAGKQ